MGTATRAKAAFEEVFEAGSSPDPVQGEAETAAQLETKYSYQAMKM